MSCLHPFRAFLTGATNEENRPVWYMDFSGRMTWITVDDCIKRGVDFKLLPGEKVHEYIEIPCGKCPGCKKSKAYQWALRCEAERHLHDFCYFVTLTYDDESLPGKLYKKDVQLYHKRLRKALGPFRFFLCGEYGSHTHRPHYHEIIFSDRPLVDLVKFTQNGEIVYYNSATISDAWRYGYCLISESNLNTAVYVSSYLNKGKTFGDEFLMMSRRPGLGGPLFDAAFSGDASLYISGGVGKGVKLNFPRYYINKTPELKKALAETLASAAVARKRSEAEARACGYSRASEDFLELDKFRDVQDELLRRPQNKKPKR